MSEQLFDTYVTVDWSAASKPVTGRDSIWIAVANGLNVTLENPPTRAEAVTRLGDILAGEHGAGRRVLAGFDFPFGYPSGAAKRICGEADALELWDWLSNNVEDAPDNANNRFAIATHINRKFDGIGPFWGRPERWAFPDVPTRAKVRRGTDHPSERRCADAAVPGTKTVWQLAYAGSVGSQVLLGLPALNRLRRDGRLSGALKIWPFETGLTTPDAPVVLAEVYPSMLPPDPAETVKDAGQVRAVAERLRDLDTQGKLARMFTGPADADDATRDVIVREEAWILGAGHEHTLRARSHPSLRYERDPAEIYRQSFATVRAETRLDHLPQDLHGVAVRLVHACGMPEITARLAWSDDVARSAEDALRAGAPILCDCEMVASGVIRARLPAQNAVVCTLNAETTPAHACSIANTRSAAAVELWRDHLAGAVVAIGNAPTALFHLLELIDAGWPRPAAILAFPVGFVGAAESKAELAANPRNTPFLTLRGRRGGSAMTAAAVNAVAATAQSERSTGR